MENLIDSVEKCLEAAQSSESPNTAEAWEKCNKSIFPIKSRPVELLQFDMSASAVSANLNTLFEMIVQGYVRAKRLVHVYFGDTPLSLNVLRHFLTNRTKPI